MNCLAKCVKSYQQERATVEAAAARLERELDVVQLVKTNRFVRNLARLLLTQRERTLMRMQADKRIVHKPETPTTSDPESDQHLD